MSQKWREPESGELRLVEEYRITSSREHPITVRIYEDALGRFAGASTGGFLGSDPIERALLEEEFKRIMLDVELNLRRARSAESAAKGGRNKRKVIREDIISWRAELDCMRKTNPALSRADAAARIYRRNDHTVTEGTIRLYLGKRGEKYLNDS